MFRSGWQSQDLARELMMSSGRMAAFIGVALPAPRRTRRRARVTAAAEQVVWGTGLGKSFDGSRWLFRGVDVGLARGAKVALLGNNGCGKSTLLALLAGDEEGEGSVGSRRGARVAAVAQELVAVPGESVVACVARLAGGVDPVVDAALRYARAVEGGRDADIEGALLGMETAGVESWSVESWLASALGRLGLDAGWMVADLSGGQRRRVGIAAALVCRPDVLLLDEVTNHLSIEGIEFLEEVLADPALTVLCISHDRYFVDSVCTTAIWELGPRGLERYGPGYAAFLDAKADRVENERKEVAVLAKTFRKELEWMRKQPKARGTKSKSRVEEFHRIKGALAAGRSRQKASTAGVRGLASASARLGSDVITLDNVTIRRGDRIIVDNFSYTFERGERVGICGGNGVGKSSLLRALLGQVPVESGSINVGETVLFGHFDQDGIDLSAPLSEASAALLAGKKGGKDLRVIDYVSELVSLFGLGSGNNGGGGGGGRGASGRSSEEEVEARLDAKIAALSASVAVQSSNSRGAESNNPLARMSPIGILDHFGFDRAQQHSFVSRLSGGERRRLQLMALLLKNPNCLLLDEVSNDLDINTLSMLEDLLVAYSGVLVLCSHDRFMLDRLVTHLLVLEGDGSVSYVEGKFTDYLADKREAAAEAKRNNRKTPMPKVPPSPTSVAEPKTSSPARKLSYKEKREYERLEAEVEDVQKRHTDLSRKLETEAAKACYGDLAAWTSELAELEATLDAKTERWVELADLSGL